MADGAEQAHTGRMLRTETIDKWVRGRLGDRLVVETRDPLLVWQGPFPPVYAFRRDEVVDDVLAAADEPEREGFSFFGPQLPVAQWYDLRAGDRVLRGGAWTEPAERCRSAARHHEPRETRTPAIGFRCVMSESAS